MHMALRMQKFVKSGLGKVLPGNAHKIARYYGVLAKEALGSDYFPAQDDLDRKILAHVGDIKHGTFIEAGANDGLAHSNTWHLERRRGWTGLLVEPDPANAALCRRFRRSIVENCAIGSFDQDGETITMHAGGGMTVAADADTTHLVGGSPVVHAEAGAAWSGRKSHSYSIPVRPLSALLDAHGLAKVDLLSLDVEGYELQALKGIDFDRHPIRFMLIETSIPAQVEALLGQRYRRAARLSHWDYLYALA